MMIICLGEIIDDVEKVQRTDFEILKVIGRGSYGKVFLVNHYKTNKIYAMKSIKK
jgi:serine/threonine protein kinase